jgi:hypothetical protein
VLVREARLLRTISELFGAGTPETISSFHTYPAVDPDRTLDYVFTTAELAFVSYRVVPRAVSDHLLVMAELANRAVRERWRDVGAGGCSSSRSPDTSTPRVTTGPVE